MSQCNHEESKCNFSVTLPSLVGSLEDLQRTSEYGSNTSLATTIDPNCCEDSEHGILQANQGVVVYEEGN